MASSSDDILNGFGKKSLGKDAYAVSYDKDATVVDKSSVHDTFVCEQRSAAIGEAANTAGKVGQFVANSVGFGSEEKAGFIKTAFDSGIETVANYQKELIKNTAKGLSVGIVNDVGAEGYSDTGDESSELVTKGRKLPFQTNKKAYGGYEKTSAVINAPGNFRATRAFKLENKADKLESRANKKYTKSLELDEKIESLSKKNKLEGLSAKDRKRLAKYSKKNDKLKKGSAQNRQKASKKANKAAKKHKKNARFSNIKSLFSGTKSGFAKLALVLGGVFLVFLGGLLIASIVGGIVAGMGNMFGSSSSQGLTDKETYVYTYLKMRGYSDEAIAGVMGNAQQESNWSTDDTRSAGYYGGLGVFQMTDDRAKKMIAFCSANNINLYSVEAAIRYAIEAEIENENGRGYQLHTSWNRRVRNNWSSYDGWNNRILGQNDEIEALPTLHVYKGNLDEFKNTTDVVAATFSWAATHERCNEGADGRFDKRVQYAKEYLQKIKSGEILKNGSNLVPDDGSAASRAYAYLASGATYVWGGCAPGIFDCSGFVSYCLTGKYEHTWSTSDFMTWAQVSVEQAQPGDICTNDHHCGLYIGNGEMIHMPGTGKGIKKTKVYDNMIIVRYDRGS